MKPLSVNEAWQGRRFKTRAYAAYEKEMLMRLPMLKMPPPPYSVHYEWGFSNCQCDTGNPEKCVSDIVQKKYGINDRDFIEIHMRKVKVRKGEEYINIRIEHYEEGEE